MRAPASTRTNAWLRAFTLAELLVSVTLLILLMGFVLQITNQTSSIWSSTTGKVQAFQESRAGFEVMTRKLAQATLNVYWDYDPPPPALPQRYIRKSELHFVAGHSADLIADSPLGTPSGHAVFFQAPTGFSENTAYQGLENLLNPLGYYVVYGSDAAIRPGFVTSAPRYRYRLVEAMQSAEGLSVYNNGAGTGWVADCVQNGSRVLAENIITMVVLPKVAGSQGQTAQSATSLTSDYAYDSRAAANPATFNQLPPIVQITMVALDERSAARLGNTNTPPDLGVNLDTLFQQVSSFESDLKTLETALAEKNLNYRVFSIDVSLRGAKWSRQ